MDRGHQQSRSGSWEIDSALVSFESVRAERGGGKSLKCRSASLKLLTYCYFIDPLNVCWVFQLLIFTRLRISRLFVALIKQEGRTHRRWYSFFSDIPTSVSGVLQLELATKLWAEVSSRCMQRCARFWLAKLSAVSCTLLSPRVVNTCLLTTVLPVSCILSM